MKYYIRISDRKSVRNRLQVAIGQSLCRYEGLLTSDIERTIQEMKEMVDACNQAYPRSTPEEFSHWKVSDNIIIRPSGVLAFTAHVIRKEV